MKKKLNIIYIICLILLAGEGLFNSLGFAKGFFKPPIFYTSLSVLICFVYFALAFMNIIIHIIRKKKLSSGNYFLFPRFKGAITMCITVTLLVYHFFVYEGPIYTLDITRQNLIMHYLVPILVILHWLIFDKKGIYKKIDPLIWTIIPLSYFTWANIFALIKTEPQWDGNWYPYGFMDLTKHGIMQVSITIVLLIIFFIGLGCLIVFIDNRLVNKKSK